MNDEDLRKYFAAVFVKKNLFYCGICKTASVHFRGTRKTAAAHWRGS